MNETFPIIKHIPVPKLRIKTLGILKNTMTAMEVGDSFLWYDRTHIYHYAKRFGVKVTAKRYGDKFRIWRIE